jgi:hypothetical protein
MNGLELVEDNTEVFCMICEEYININKVDDHSNLCGKTNKNLQTSM